VHFIGYNFHSTFLLAISFRNQQFSQNSYFSVGSKQRATTTLDFLESLQSHFILTMSHWSSGLPICFPSQGTRVQIPWGYSCETGILLLALSRYIGDPDVIDHFCGFVWGGLCPEPSLGPHSDNVIIPFDLTQLFCPGFTLAAGPPSSFTTDGDSCWGGALWRACNLTLFSPCLTGPLDYPFASRHKGPGFKSPGGYLCDWDSPVSVVSLHSTCI
jgi:hypothetical protein